MNEVPDQELQGSDCIVRGTAASGMIRALAIDGTQTVREAQQLHGMAPAATNALGRLLMAAQIVASLLKVPGETISLMVRGDGPLGGLTVTADSVGNVKGYATNPLVQAATTDAAAVSALVGQGELVVVRESPHMEPYVSQIALTDGTIVNDLMAYYMLSEQVPTLIGLEVLFDAEGTVSHAGGYFIQLMPGYEPGLAAKLMASVGAAEPLSYLLEQTGTASQSQVDAHAVLPPQVEQQLKACLPTYILEKLLAGLDFRPYETLPAAWHCDCSRERSERTLLSLGASELEDMIAANEPITITCDFCNKGYTFSVEDLAELHRVLR